MVLTKWLSPSSVTKMEAEAETEWSRNGVSKRQIIVVRTGWFFISSNLFPLTYGYDI
jgi:hypothetical protein